jgi:hypothetical protein
VTSVVIDHLPPPNDRTSSGAWIARVGRVGGDVDARPVIRCDSRRDKESGMRGWMMRVAAAAVVSLVLGSSAAGSAGSAESRRVITSLAAMAAFE